MPRFLPWLMLALLVACVAFGLRAATAIWLPLSADESQSVVEFWWPSLWLEQERFFNPPGWRALMMGLLRLTDELVLLRLAVAALAAGACGWFFVALRAPNPGPGLSTLAAAMAGLGLAATPWAARSQGLARAYGATLLATVAIVAALAALLRRPDRRRHLLAGLAVGVAAWVHFTTLLWVGAWLVAVIVTCRRAGHGTPDAMEARERRMFALWRQAMPGLVLACLLLLLPIWLAAGGWQLKRGAGSASMAALAADLLWRPEPWLAVLTLVGAWRARRRWPVEVALSLASLLIGLVILAASSQTQTVRWTHLVVAAPGLWLGLALALETAERRDRAPMALVLAGVLLWGAASHLGTLATAHRQEDDRVLARWRANRGIAHLAAYVATDEPAARSVGRGLLHAAGGHRDDEARCLGADRVHLARCRARVRAIARTRCRALCDHVGCIWHLEGLPAPSAPAAAAGAACAPGVLVSRLPVALAVLDQAGGPSPGQDAGAWADRLHLPPGAINQLQVLLVGRWHVLLRMDRDDGAGSMAR